MQCKPTVFCGRYGCVGIFVRIGCELIGRRIDKINILQIQITTYFTAFTLHYWHVFLISLEVQREICCLMVFRFYIYIHFLVLLWPDYCPSWGSNGCGLIHILNKFVGCVWRFFRSFLLTNQQEFSL